MNRITFLFVILFIRNTRAQSLSSSLSISTTETPIYANSTLNSVSSTLIELTSESFSTLQQNYSTLSDFNLSNQTNTTQPIDTRPKFLFTGDDQKRPGLGINLGPIDPYMPQWVFTNIFKHAREWRIMSSSNNWVNFTAAGAIPTDWSSDGFPLNFSYSNRGYQTELGTGGVYPTGDYILTFEGTGNLSIVGDAENVIKVNSNKFTFHVSKTTTKGIVIVVTKANVTNIDLREAIDEFRTETFGRNFTKVISPFEALRFSSWTQNRYNDFYKSDANVDWSNRRPATYYTQVGMHMVSIEYMVELANTLSKDIWLSVPKTANSNFTYNMALYVKNNINNKSIIYVEQSSDKGWQQQDHNAQMQVIQIWKSVFGSMRSRLKFVLSTTIAGYFENVMTYYTDTELKEFDAYAVSGGISEGLPYNGNNFDVTQTVNYTTSKVLDDVRQQIYKDEINFIYQMQKVAIKMNKPLYAYSVDININAPNFQNRFYKLPNAAIEQKFDDLIVESLRQPIVEDLLLDFFERWWKSGCGLMFMSNVVNRINRCENGGPNCGYKSLMENLLQDPLNVPKYRAAIQWLNGNRSNLPFTSDDVIEPPPVPCSKCVWGVCYNGTCNCFNGYIGTACDQSVKKYLDCASNSTEFGVNPDGIVDWSQAVTFVDLHRRARKWIVQKIVFSTKWADWDQEDVQLREDGYPKYLEIGKTVGTVVTRDLHAHYPNGKYVVLYDGDGALEFMFLDTKVIRQDAGRIEMWVTHKTEMNNGIYYSILRTNPSNPIRNVRIMEARFEKTYKYFPFHPLYLEIMKKFQVIRYMPWSNVFLDQIVDWSNRTLNSYYSFATGTTGVSIEMQVALANFLGLNPWFNLPHRATDDYLRNISIYIRDNLRPDVKVYFEIGNECWGSGGPHECGNYAERMGLLANMTLKARQQYYNKDVAARICYHAKTGQYFFNIIKDVYGEANRTRLKFVLNTQAAWTGPIEMFFLCQGDYYKSFDVVAIAPYLSYDLKKNDSSLYSVDDVFNFIVDLAIKDVIKYVNNTVNVLKANAPTMELATYESGPDFSSLGDTNNIYLTNLSIYIHRDPRMQQAVANYIQNLTRTEGFNLKVFNYFTATGPYSKYGCWGMIESTDANLYESPKYLAYMGVIDSFKRCEWDEKPNTCTNNCNLLGVCSSSHGSNVRDTCECFFGYNGTACQSFNYIVSSKCTYQCGGHGTCEFDHYDGYYEVHACHCNQGYYGYGCGLFNCTDECNWNGKCIDSETCSCYRGYKGAKCEINCGCNGHGNCSNDTNACICDRGYQLVNGVCVIDCSVDTTRAECLKCSIDCANGTCIKGNCVCWAGFKYDSRKSCRVPTRASNDGAKLGINMNGIVDWSPQWAFVDLIKQARYWIIQHIDNLDDLYWWSVNEKFELTSDHYPASVPFNRQLVTIMLRDVKQRWPDGVYHLFYDGEGVIEFGFDSKIIESNEKYRMKIMVNLTLIRDNGVFMKIKKTNPKNPLRNIRLIMDGFQDTYNEMPFHPLFLEKLAPFKTIRFMEWTGQDDIIKWSDRVTPNSYSHHRGVAYEYQIQLANVLKKNAWIIIPYQADDDFVRQTAILFKNNLRKDVKINLEYSNEVWNSFFNSGIYAQKMGIQLGLSTDKTIAGNYFYSMRMQQIMNIWKDVFQSEKDRIVLVAGSFSLMPIMSERILSYNNAYKVHNQIMLALTGYIGCNDPPASTVVIADMAELFDGCKKDLPNMKSYIDKHYAIAKKYNVSLGMYESGSGMMELSTILSGSETAGATEKYIAMNKDIRFYDVYKDYYRLYDTYNMTENCHYAFINVYSKYGPWLLLEYMTQSIADAHRYRAYLELINETRLPFQNITENPNCFSLAYNKTEVCNANGVCISPDYCECDLGFFGKTCVPFDASKTGEDLFAKLDSRIVALLIKILPNSNKEQIATLASNRILWGPILDSNLNNTLDCKVRELYFNYLEERLAQKNDTEWVTFKRLNQTLDCKQDCNFDKILSINGTSFGNTSQFITQVLPYLNSNAAFQCKSLYSSFFTITTSSLLNNIEFISMVTPDKIDSMSQNDSLKLAMGLSENKKIITPSMAKTLADNLPSNTPLDQIASIASQMPFTSIDNTNPRTLVNILNTMDINNMDDFKKVFIVNKITSSNDDSLITNMLNSASDSDMINSVPAESISNSVINNVPASRLPDACLKNYSRTILQTQNLSSISDSSTLSKILPGVSRSDLNKIEPNAKINSIVNMVNASLTKSVPLTSIQRADMLNTLLEGLKSTAGSSDPNEYLKSLTTIQLETLYPLFIEANSTILASFSKLNTFSTLLTQIASIASSKCCSYSRFSRQLFASYAIPYLFSSSSSLTTDNLYTLGTCLASALSATYLKIMSPTVFVNYYSTNGGSSFQPNEDETIVVKSHIASLASSYSSQNTYFFNTLNDLAMYYPITTYSSNLTLWKTNGMSLITKIKSARDPTDESIQLCRIGLTNTQSTIDSINTVGVYYVQSMLSNAKRKKRSAGLTCSDINNLGGSLNSLTVAQLSSLNSAEFISCQVVLGASTNSWSSSQLSALATVAKAAYPVISSISDTNISQLKSILLGFADTDLQSLVFTTTTSISALGSLSGWSSAQLTGLAQPLETYITGTLSGTITTSFLTSTGNLACALSTARVNSITNAVFSGSVSALARISLTCPNIGSFYTIAKRVYGNSVLTTASTLSQIGTIINGVSQSDFSQITYDIISSISTTAWTYMPVSIVNSMSLIQILGLSNSQLSSLMNSPNYAQYSSTIQNYISALSTGTVIIISSSSNSQSASSSGLSAGAIAGIVIGLVLLGIVVIIGILIIKDINKLKKVSEGPMLAWNDNKSTSRMHSFLINRQQTDISVKKQLNNSTTPIESL